MKKLLTMIVGALVAASTLASAFAADLPPRRPYDLPAPAAPTVPVFAQTGFYAGASIGYAARAEQLALGLNAGYDFGNVRLELGYDHFGTKKGESSNMVSGLAILENTYGRFTPYVLAGAGFRFSEGNYRWDDRYAVYVVGTGLRFALTQNIEIDGRYRYVGPMQVNKGHDHVGTIGVNYRF